jgi:hypothetical protein
VLNVVGADSVPRFTEGSDLVQSWFPQAERLVVPDAGHLLMVQNPTALAHGLNDFFSRHPIGGGHGRGTTTRQAGKRRRPTEVGRRT